MNWYSLLTSNKLLKTAKEIGHGDTLDGQFLKREIIRISREVDRLRLLAATGGPDGVLPRWKGTVRHSILLLPPSDRIGNMSMSELKQVSKQLAGIKQTMQTYSVSRLREIVGDVRTK